MPLFMTVLFGSEYVCINLSQLNMPKYLKILLVTSAK